MTREEFLEHVWAWKAESGGNINQQLRRLEAHLVIGAAESLHSVIQPGSKMAEAVTKAFVEMYGTGLIYRDKRW
jgi:valyl-tRNA synthetase